MKHTVREVQLKNGSRGLLIHVPDSKIMYFNFNFRAGDYLSPDNKVELAHMLEHMVLGANQSYRSADKFSAILERNGAYGNASTGSYHIDYEVECADFEWQRILELLMLSMSQPLFLESEFQSEFKVVQEELVQRSNNNRNVLALKVMTESGFTPYTYEAGLESMKNITIDDLKRFYRQTHFAGNVRFIITGNVYSKHKKITSMLERLDLPSDTRQRIQLPQEVARGSAKPIVVNRRDVRNMYFLFNTFCPQVISQPERDSLFVLNSILAGDFSSMIFGRARKRGLVYGLYTDFYMTTDSSVWSIEGQVSKENALALFELIAWEVKKILTGKLKQSDLQRSKQRILGRHQLALQTIASLAAGYRRYFMDGKIPAYDIYPERIKSVTRQRIVDVFTKLFEDENWCLGLLGSLSKSQQSLLHSKISSIWPTKTSS